MNYLLDTNAVSEWVKPRPNLGLVRWLDEVDEDRTYLSVVTVGELRKGVDRLEDGRRRRQLDQWLSVDLIDRFEGRLLPVDVAVADTWGNLLAAGELAGSAVGAVDGLIAATARAHELEVITRDVAPFVAAGVAVSNPWT